MQINCNSMILRKFLLYILGLSRVILAKKKKKSSHQNGYMFILGVYFWARDFAILTQSRDKSRESCNYWISYNWAKSQKSPVKEKNKYFCAALHLDLKKKKCSQMKNHFYNDMLCFYLAIKVKFSPTEQWFSGTGEMRSSAALEGDLCSFWLQVLSAVFSFTMQPLNFGLIERFVVSYKLPVVGLQPDAFPHSPHLLFEHKAFISLLQGNELMLWELFHCISWGNCCSNYKI